MTQPRPGTLVRVGRACAPTVRYWMETEVHVYAFSIAANVLLSFFPFLIVMLSLCRYVLHWQAAEAAIFMALRDYYPGETGDFIVRNLNATVSSRGALQLISMLLLFFTANGIFEPLEVALNRAWGITVNRSFVKNQVVSFGLIFACGGLFLLSTVFTAANWNLVIGLTGGNEALANYVLLIVFKSAAIPISIFLLFLVYWLLPNRRMPPAVVIPAAVMVGFALELLKYVSVLMEPWLRAKLRTEYGPFVNSVTIVLWSFIASMIVLGGAEWSARRLRRFSAC